MASLYAYYHDPSVIDTDMSSYSTYTPTHAIKGVNVGHVPGMDKNFAIRRAGVSGVLFHGSRFTH